MKKSNKERTLTWIKNQYDKGNISFKHRLQRPVGQWNPKMKSLLIHSLLSDMPINPIYIVDQDDVLYTLDGSQRTWTCIDYIDNGFALSKDTPNVTIKIKENGETIEKEFEIAGKRFKKLDKEVQDTLMASGFTFVTLSEYTDEEVREMFKRQNSSRPLQPSLMYVVDENDEFAEIVYSLATHPFMRKIITPSQVKAGKDRNVIRQTLMLIETNSEHEYLSFRKEDITNFIISYQDNIDMDKIDILRKALDRLNNEFIEEKIKINIMNIPMMLYASYAVLKKKASFGKLVELINNFLIEGCNSDEYKGYCDSGTNNRDKVEGRYNYWKNMIKSA